MNELDQDLKEHLNEGIKTDKELEDLMEEALTGSEPLNYDTLMVVVHYLDRMHHAEAMVRLMRTGVIKAVYGGEKINPDSKIKINDYALYLAENEKKVTEKHPWMKKRLDEMEEMGADVDE